MQQYLRKCNLTLTNTTGGSLRLDQLHVKFQIKKAVTGTPQTAMIRVYNVNKNTVSQIDKEFYGISLDAGYEGNIATIFKGTIRQILIGRENSTDTYMDLICSDGDEAYNFATTNQTIPKGSNQAVVMQHLSSDYTKQNIAVGYVPEFKGPPLPRAKVMYGMTKDYLNGLAESSGCEWHVNNGQLNMVPVYTPLPGTTTVITANTGMIGQPRQTLNGVQLRVLLNPQIKNGGLIQIDNASIQQIQLDITFGGQATNIFYDPATGVNTGLDADGIYKVYSIDMVGDTRGQDWYFDLICASLTGQGPINAVFVNAQPSQLGF